MAIQAISKVVASSAIDSSAVTNTYEKRSTDADQDGTAIETAEFKKRPPSDTESSEIGDGVFRQHIEKDDKQVLVVWDKHEEARVVRKADFLFLPLFSVRKSSTRRDLACRPLTTHS